MSLHGSKRQFDSRDMARRGRVSAHTTHSRHDSRRLTERAREQFFAKFIDEVDPNRSLPEDERLRRADHAMKAHLARIALKSARSRAKTAKKLAAEGKSAASEEVREVVSRGMVYEGGGQRPLWERQTTVASSD